MEQPLRENETGHQCVCLLVIRATSVIGGESVEVHDKCHVWVNSMDQPFCRNCEVAGHPNKPEQLPMENRSNASG